MRIGFRSYWKIDRFMFLPLLGYASTSCRTEFMVLGFGLVFWRA